MFLFDLHCDTLTTAKEESVGLVNHTLQVSLDRLHGHRWCQCFAIWLPDEVRGQAAIDYLTDHADYFLTQVAAHKELTMQAKNHSQMVEAIESGRVAALLTVEGGGVLGGKLETVDTMANYGVKAMTLTWNGANEIAGGQATEEGFSEFGRAAVKRMEQLGIAVDVSHLNDRSFWELEKFVTRPILATHSNCRVVHECGRNLTDDQLRAISGGGGVVGMTFYKPFLDDDKGDFDCLCRHMEHALTVCGENAICLGGDFDGGVTSDWLTGSGAMAELHRLLTGRFGAALTDKICGQNALDFWKRYEENA
ncbi:MAG: membrane dipeptidase [Angelakisella sp.]